MKLEEVMARRPLVAILRGVVPEVVDAVGDILVRNELLAIEVPLNSPRPFDSIAILAERFGKRATIGAGTVVRPDELDQLAEAGGKFAVSPHLDVAIVQRALELGISPMPGVTTPSEAMTAWRSGVQHLKLFPAEMIGIPGLRAMRAVLPTALQLIPVGGIGPEDVKDWLESGAAAVGAGSSLFSPHFTLDQIEQRARRFSKQIAPFEE